MYRINDRASWKEKEGTIVFYLDFDYYFFKDESAKLLIKVIEQGNKVKDVPESFIEYLKEKEILL